MTSTLTKQLKQLAAANESQNISSKACPSLLFDGKEAADMDLDTVYALGMNGLTELEQVDPEFTKFKHSMLFHSTSKDWDYRMQTVEHIQIIDQQVRTLLRKLSSYVLLKPAQKVLEWLIRRFAIHERHVANVIGCLLPYHETSLFVKMVQLLRVPESSPFLFLTVLKRTRQPLMKSTLVEHCLDRHAVLLAICDTIEEYRKEGDLSKTLHGFIVSLMVLMLRNIKGGHIHPSILQTVLAYLLRGIQEYQDSAEGLLGCYMILSQLTSVIQLDAETTNALLVVLSRRLTKNEGSYEKETLLCIASMVQSQRLPELPTKLVQRLVVWNESIRVMGELAVRYHLNHFVHIVLVSVLNM